jgi:hypothetical protein
MAGKCGVAGAACAATPLKQVKGGTLNYERRRFKIKTDTS